MKLGLILIGLAVFIVGWGIGSYNKLVLLRERVKNALGQIAAQLESRWDALSSLIQATKTYSKHEAEVLENVTKMRTGVGKNSTVEEIMKDMGQFQELMGRINVVVEAYPELKADKIYQSAMNSINQYENNVRQARMIYNDTVTKYNSGILVFPRSLIASMFGFKEKEYFENSDSKTEMPMWN